MSRLERRARKAAGSRRLPREARERLREELLTHLEASAASYRRLGVPEKDAERHALQDFGDAGRLEADIGRAWAGRPFVILPQTPGERFRASAVQNMRALLVIVTLVILLRWQVVAAYHIPTKSMEPTLHGDPVNGDMILVDKTYYRLHAPSRWQIAVFDREGENKSLVKRIAGLSGEELDIRDGDLVVDGKVARKPREVQDELLVPVYAGGRDLLADVVGEERTGLDAWIPQGEWKLEGTTFAGAPDESGKASLGFRGDVLDNYPGGMASDDALPVEDLALSFRVVPGEGATVVAGLLRERSEVYEVELPVGAGDAVLLRDKEEIGRAAGVFLPRGEEKAVRFANIDDRVTVEIDGVEVLGADVPVARGRERIGLAAEFAVAGGPAEFREVTLSRDIFYRSEGRLPFKVPEGCCYMLGDNSGNSQDSRTWGAVPAGRLIGRPVLIFWPVSRVRLVK